MLELLKKCNSSMKTFLLCAHTDINYTNIGCMTGEEKQEIQYQRYLTSIH